ncbi:D-dopachrome decarboxylase isoform X2 [Syngnathoides biaculeatus]|uniref:D-dopachrome decarboxylase isoform X2 n=1 Tax=Syngnathoides biaculeatus TaxID=300417 RepID=UPI002ADDCE88|nr:D-dopachrome decarboxylase isoform X2 [Syngnathoides biaculeatus]XP_061686953.1 D-dopachrome decarboxylase isoform X2 [Syngnathoides biaculeatus]
MRYLYYRVLHGDCYTANKNTCTEWTGRLRSVVSRKRKNMPFVDLQSNLPANSFPEEFLKKMCSFVASILGKPVDRMHLIVKPGLPMILAGSCSPCVVMSISAIGVTDTADKNKDHSAKLFEFLTRELTLTEDRIALQFYNLQPHQVGKKGTVMSFL